MDPMCRILIAFMLTAAIADDHLYQADPADEDDELDDTPRLTVERWTENAGFHRFVYLSLRKVINFRK